jgi:hypothetical protein
VRMMILIKEIRKLNRHQTSHGLVSAAPDTHIDHRKKNILMGSVKFIESNGKRILYIDAANCDLEEMMMLFERTKVLLVKEPLGSVLTLTSLNKGVYHGVFRKIAKEFTTHNKPYVKAAAIVGLAPQTVKEFEEVINYSHREFKFFDDLPHALAWLDEQ